MKRRGGGGDLCVEWMFRAVVGATGRLAATVTLSSSEYEWKWRGEGCPEGASFASVAYLGFLFILLSHFVSFSFCCSHLSDFSAPPGFSLLPI